MLYIDLTIGELYLTPLCPSTVFVVLAWLSLFVPAESVPGRVGMGMTTLLTLTAMFSAVRCAGIGQLATILVSDWSRG